MTKWNYANAARRPHLSDYRLESIFEKKKNTELIAKVKNLINSVTDKEHLAALYQALKLLEICQPMTNKQSGIYSIYCKKLNG